MKRIQKNWGMNRKDMYVTIAAFVLCLFVSLTAVCRLEMGSYQELREKTGYVTKSQVSRLQYVIETLLLKTQTLEMLVMEGDGQITNFEKVAAELCDNTAIRSLQLAPNGNVTQVYPLQGNEDAFGDLFGDEERSADAVLARDSGKMTLSGPFELYQGGLGVIGRRPIYLTDENGVKSFWGFSIIVLDMPDAFYPAKLDNFTAEGFEYKLYRHNPETGGQQIIDESSDIVLQKPVESSFQVPNGTWIFSVMPRDGWYDTGKITVEIVISVLASLLVAVTTAALLYFIGQKEILYRITITDRLTGLMNYTKFMQQLGNYMDKKTPFVLYFMDLDGFKKINDTYGHTMGNVVLEETARRLESCFGAYGEVFRNGGDEFCAIVTQSMEKDFYEQLLQEVITCFKTPFFLKGESVRCGISIGYSRYPEDNDNMEKLIQLADDGMYRMKHNPLYAEETKR